MSSNTNSVPAGSTKTNVRTMVMIAMLGAISMVLMWFEIPLWFAPAFYKMDLSEVPVMIGAFALGPVAGAMIELVKVLLKLVTKGTTTAFVGDIANYIIGCALILPAGIIYKQKKSKKNAIIGMAAGTVFLTIVGCFLNAYVLLPAYGKAFGMEVEKLVAMGTAVNPAINSVATFVILAVAPFNLIKGAVVSVITLILYKYVSPLLKGHQL
ncbi:MAG: ECF transporter S component [Eubacteriales bacterium]|nr:ECF transporter S component [Eubacteriales bacterium]